MTKPIHPVALFRLSVLGPLASRDKLNHGEIKTIVDDLASKTYLIPNSNRTRISAQAIEKWYYAWRQGGIDALTPKTRSDKDKTLLPESVKEALLEAKRQNPARSLNTLIQLLERQGIVARNRLARATVHRFLKHHQLSKRTLAPAQTIERRAFVAEYASDIWHGDVMHGPSIQTTQGQRKAYLVSFLDDASRLITHSAFCLGETALDIEGVLKEAVMKRGLPKKIIIDNGAAYRSNSLQGICARLAIRLIYCRPYEPEGKGKLERYHRTFRESFLTEINLETLTSLADLNARLWAWVETIYHQTPHSGLDNRTPLARWQQDLVHIKPLGQLFYQLEDIFCHRLTRFVRKDGTLTWEGYLFEVPYEYAGLTVVLVIDPHRHKALHIESQNGENLGPVTPLDARANINRKRQRPVIPTHSDESKCSLDMVEIAYQDYKRQHCLSNSNTNPKLEPKEN